MKALRTILLILAILLIAFNAISYVKGPLNIPEGTSHAIAYLIGRNSFFIVGGILLLVVYLMGNKIKEAEKKKTIDSFLK